MLYLATFKVIKKWTMSAKSRGKAHEKLAITYEWYLPE